MGIFFAVLSGMMVVLVQGPILRRALKKFSEEKLVIIGSVILGTNFALLISNNVVLIYGAPQYCLHLVMALCSHL
jgi:MFS transporter, DHA1 family, tetracycline resistance protein